MECSIPNARYDALLLDFVETDIEAHSDLRLGAGEDDLQGR